MTEFQVIPALRIGTIVEVEGNSIRLELDTSIKELTRIHEGRVYPIGQYASIIKIHYGRRVLLAYVRLLRMRSEIAREEGVPPPAPSEDARVIDADLFGEGVWEKKPATGEFKFIRGVRHYPLPGQAGYITTQTELRHIYRSVESVRADEARREGVSAMIPIGSYVGSGGTPSYANLDKLFGLHCAVLGSTGSGKSGAVSVILHSSLEAQDGDGNRGFRPRVLVIDPHGEYAPAFGDRCIRYRAYEASQDLQASAKSNTEQLQLPYWLMSAEEFRELVVGKTEREATSENNIVFKAITHARLVERGWIEKARNWSDQEADSNVDPAAPRPINELPRELIAEYDRDTPDPFSLDEFERHIRLEQAIRSKQGQWKPVSPTDYKPYASVLDKLSVLRTDPRTQFMMAEYREDHADLPGILQQFVGEIGADTEERDIRIIDISGLPNEVAGPLTAAIARLLFQYKVWQTREERERDPVLFVCEEAHRYVPDTGLAEYQAAQKAVRRIAKEGRKYGIGLMLVSQRPADVERTVLSQCSSWLVLRLTNATDQEHVSRFLPDSLAGLTRTLPSLARREALFVGEAATLPARILLTQLERNQLPHSGDISFARGWARPPVTTDAISTVVKRWRREGD